MTSPVVVPEAAREGQEGIALAMKRDLREEKLPARAAGEQHQQVRLTALHIVTVLGN